MSELLAAAKEGFIGAIRLFFGLLYRPRAALKEFFKE
jgi:hypothetical protein